jgi:ribonucleoside-diphosphate reductase alpha chain
MYYLRTKSAVDAIKFTLAKEEKKQDAPAEATKPAAVPVPEGTSLSPEELRALIASSKEAEGDDCLMCGS